MCPEEKNEEQTEVQNEPTTEEQNGESHSIPAMYCCARWSYSFRKDVYSDY